MKAQSENEEESKSGVAAQIAKLELTLFSDSKGDVME